MRNPLLEEAGQIYLRRREYLLLHLAYLVAAAFLAVVLWPSQGLVYFFRTETVPASFQATTIMYVIGLTGMSLYIGMDKLAEEYIIRYSEWLERTSVPIGVLFTGKMAAAALHSVFLVAAGAPFAIVAAGPAGIPLRAVLATELIILLAAMTGRVGGMIVAYLGESRYVIRVVGGWVFLALLFLATIRILPALNPIVAVVRQYADESVFMQVGRTASAETPLLSHGLPMLGLLLVLASVLLLVLFRHHALARRGGSRDA